MLLNNYLKSVFSYHKKIIHKRDKKGAVCIKE